MAKDARLKTSTLAFSVVLAASTIATSAQTHSGFAASATATEGGTASTDGGTATGTTTGAPVVAPTPPVQTPIAQQPAYMKAQAAVSHLSSKLADIQNLIGILDEAHRATDAFTISLADGNERTGMGAPFRLAIAPLTTDLGDKYKALSDPDPDLGTDPSSTLAALTALPAQDQEAIDRDSLKNQLQLAQSAVTSALGALKKAADDLGTSLGTQNDALAAAVARGREAVDFFELKTYVPKETLPKIAGNLRTIGRLKRGFDGAKDHMLADEVRAAYDSLKAFNEKPPTKLGSDPNIDLLTALNDDLSKADPQKALDAAGTQVVDVLDEVSQALNASLGGTATDPRQAVRDAEEMEASLVAIETVNAGDYHPLPKSQTVAGWLTRVDTYRRLTARQASRVRELLEGDYSEFVTDTVSLYYFPDVKRLITTLNPDTKRIDPATIDGEESGASQLKAKQASLRAAEVAYQKAYVELTEKTGKLAAKRVEVEEKERLSRLTQNLTTGATRIRDASTRVHDSDLIDLQHAQTAANAKAGLPDTDAGKIRADKVLKRTEKKEAASKARLAEDEAALTDATTKDNDAKTAAATAKTDADSLRTETDGLSGEAVEAAKTLRAARFDLQSSQEDELKAFAFERDNKPFYRTTADASSLDPAKKVVMYAYDDSKTILIRGPKDAVEQVKDIIAQFDAPTPQARITLWSLDMNVTSSRNGRQNLGNVLGNVDRELLSARQKTGEAVRAFQDAVSFVARKAETDNAHYLNNGAGITLDAGRMARLNFFQTEVAQRLGFDPEDAQTHQRRYYFSRWTVPDPAGSTTLGEALMMFFLAKRQYRNDVLDRLEVLLNAQLPAVDSRSDKRARFQAQQRLNKETECLKRFVDRLREMTHTTQVDAATDGLTSQQLEIVNALKRSALDKFIGNAPALCRLYAQFYGKSFPVRLVSPNGTLVKGTEWSTDSLTFGNVSATNKTLDGSYKDGKGIQVLSHRYYESGKLLQWDQSISVSGKSTPSSSNTEPSNEAIEVAYYLWPLFGWFKEEFGISPETFAQAHVYAAQNLDKLSKEEADKRYSARCVQYFRSLFPRDIANARIAAADEMLKEMMVQWEDALDDAYVQPTLTSLRQMVVANGIDVGQFQRTSLLASNRYIARVAPSASAQLDLAGQTNVLEDAQQLLGFVTAVQTAQIPGIASAFNRLSGKEPAPQLYALNGKSSFVVTPVFDPSGQALRFQFDYLKTLNIQSPDGTTDPELPRVESYPISLPVQISNLELREVTRFETNTKLGIPPKQWGGIPILNQVPGLRDLPLIGWFSKRDGKAAVSQQTIVLAQTATYPTIVDISQLLTGSFGLYLTPAEAPK